MRFYNDLSQDYYRLKNVLISDKQFNPDQVMKSLNADLCKILKNYGYFNPCDLVSNMTIDENGNYILSMKVKFDRLKIFGHI